MAHSTKLAKRIAERLAEEKPYGWRSKPTDARVDLPEFNVVVAFDDHMSRYKVSRKVLEDLPRDASADDIKDTLLSASKTIEDVDGDPDAEGIFLDVAFGGGSTADFFEAVDEALKEYRG